MGRRRVGIIGAGIGGLAAAAFLARSGHAVRVLERAPSLRPVGAGLLLQPTGMGVLDRLGLAGRVRAAAAPVERLLGTTRRGRIVMDLRYADLRVGLHGLGVQRAVLHGALLDAALDAGAEIVTGAAVERVADGTDAAGLRRAVAGGAIDESLDLVVIADGARSALRAHAGRVSRERRYPWGALWFVAREAPASLARTLRQVYDGTGTMLGFLPSGRTAEGERGSVSLFWSIRERTWRAGIDFDAWRRTVRALLPEASPIVDQIRSEDELIFAPYFDVGVRPSAARVAVIGDAAHAMSPQLGQGANLAMLDAADLADAIGSETTVPRAIRAARRRGRRRTAYYTLATRALTPWFQSDTPLLSGVMGAARDLAMGPSCVFPPMRTAMLRTLTGLAR